MQGEMMCTQESIHIELLLKVLWRCPETVGDFPMAEWGEYVSGTAMFQPLILEWLQILLKRDEEAISQTSCIITLTALESSSEAVW